MDHEMGQSSLKNRLTLSDEAVWLIVAEQILPRVRRELTRRFGVDRRWVNAEDAALSACRTVYRRLKTGQAATYPIENLDDLEILLFAIAHRKLVDAIRATARESRHASRVADVQHVIEAESEQIREHLIERVEQLLETDAERMIFREKMSGATEEAIAGILCKSSGVPWSKYMVREAWRRFRQRIGRQVKALRG